MSLKEEILKILNTPKYYYKGIPVSAFFLPVFNNYSKESVRNNFYRLQENGYIEKSGHHFVINKNGKDFLNKVKKNQLKNFEMAENSTPKNLLLLYDIPESKKNERDWFRKTLIKFGFVMVQRSVWVGPSPLPKDFLDYTKEIGLKDSIKTFKLKTDYKISN